MPIIKLKFSKMKTKLDQAILDSMSKNTNDFVSFL